MTESQQMERRPAPCVTPQALAWDGHQFWLSSRDLKQLYRLRKGSWEVEEEIDPPGGVWAAVAVGDALYLTIGVGDEDDRYVYRYRRDEGFTRLFACPGFEGSYLSYDGQHLYLSQWYKGRILMLGEAGELLNEIAVGAEICGHTIIDRTLFVLRGTESNGESWRIAELSLGGRSAVRDIAAVPFAARSLVWVNGRFWSNHRAQNEIVSFAVA